DRTRVAGCSGRLGAPDLPLGTRRTTEMGAVATRKMGRGLKAPGRRDIDDGHRRLEQQLAATAQTHRQGVAVRDTGQMTLEEPLDLPPRERGRGCDLIE